MKVILNPYSVSSVYGSRFRNHCGFLLSLMALGITSCQSLSEAQNKPSTSLVEVVFSSSLTLPEKFDQRFSLKPVTASFGSFGQIDFSGSRLRSLSQSYGAMTRGTELRLPADDQAVALCGPSVHTNELVCLNQVTGELLDRMPIPGELSAMPLFHNGSWILATSKGFLFRTIGLSEHGSPVLGMESFSFWGAPSRQRMAFLRDAYRANLAQSSEKQSGTDSQLNSDSGDKEASSDFSPESQGLKAGSGVEYLQVGWNWFHWSSAEFVSHLAIQGTRIIGLTSNQFVYAIEFDSGKIAWATRVAQNENLRISSQALAVSSRYVIVGTSEGQVLFLSPTTGKIEWQQEFSRDLDKRFFGVVAQPLVVGQRILASNATSQTMLLNERNQKPEWTIPFGSIASPKRLGDFFFLGTTDGKVLKLDAQFGKIEAEYLVSRGEPVASLAVVESGKSLLVAMRSGKIVVVDLDTMKESASFDSMGNIEGEIAGTENSGGYCVTTVEGLARCFSELKNR